MLERFAFSYKSASAKIAPDGTKLKIEFAFAIPVAPIPSLRNPVEYSIVLRYNDRWVDYA
jgi:hypothetical protein